MVSALAIGATCQSAPPASPGALFDLILSPHSTGGTVDRLDVVETFSGASLKAGDTLVRLPLVIASIPTARYDGSVLQAKDEAGPLGLSIVDEAATSVAKYRSWKLDRAPQGRIEVRFGAPPRTVGPTTRPGPLFDVRAEAGGLAGAGLTFLALPVLPGWQHIRLHWNLTAMPASSRGVTSLGLGDIDTTEPLQTLAESYFAAGPLKSFPENGKGRFSMYWLAQPPFDPIHIASDIRQFYSYEARFFGDPNSDYRVFVRKQPYRAGGGTALTRSFMFGYSELTPPDPAHLQFLLAHEITHNWPRIEGKEADQNWFAEGSAEYYSLLLLLRSGVISQDQFLDAFNDRAEAYYTNPFQSLTIDQASERSWQDDRAQIVPYGRGMLYLANTDAEIRTASRGRRSLDDVEQALVAARRAGKTVGLDQWLALVSHELGPRAVVEYKAMASGMKIEPRANVFAPCLKPVPAAMRMFELGFEHRSMTGGGHRVQGLVADSQAAKAGIQNGDLILDHSDIQDTEGRADAEMILTLKRGNQVFTADYLPRGATVQGYRWIRQAASKPDTCRI